MMRRRFILLLACAALPVLAQPGGPAEKPIVLHAARLLDVESGNLLAPGENLIRGDRIAEVARQVSRPPGAVVTDLGDRTLPPGLIDAHVHLFLHPGAEDLQTVQESVPQRTIMAVLAARDNLMAGFTAERDMGTEGAGSADTAVRNAIDSGRIPGPRMRISGNAVDLLGGHEDAIHFNPDQHVLPNATWADSIPELITVIRQQFKEGADFIKIYATGHDSISNGQLSSIYQYTEEELVAAVREAARVGKRVRSRYGRAGDFVRGAGRGGVDDHAYQLSDETMRVMRDKGIFAVPTFTIVEYFRDHAAGQSAAAREGEMLGRHAQEFRKQIAAGVAFAMGSDVGPFPHGTQAREFELMVQYGMKPLAAIQAGTVNAAKLLGWAGQIGALKAGYLADVIAVQGNPLENAGALKDVSFVMKGGVFTSTERRYF